MKLARDVAGKAEAFAPPLNWDGVCAAIGIDPGLTEENLIAPGRLPVARRTFAQSCFPA